jgi:ABC-2 type transport system permease protein
MRTVWGKTLHDCRRAALGWGLGLGFVLLLSMAALGRAYPSEQARAQLARQLTSTLSVANLFYGEPRHLEQFPGLVEWRSLGLYPVLVGLFLVLTAAGVTRGAEERNELEIALVAPRTKRRFFTEQAVALAAALLGLCVCLWVALVLGGPLAGEQMIAPAFAALAVANVGLAAAMFGALALLIGQFARTRRATAWIGGVALFAAHIWSNLGLTVPAVAGARWLSPLSLYGRSSPLADHHVDLLAFALMAALAVGCTALAAHLFARRDLYGTTHLPGRLKLRRSASRSAPVGRAWLLGNGFARGVRGTLGLSVAWGVALAAFVALLTALTPSLLALFQDQAGMQQFLVRLGRGTLTTDAYFLSFLLFGFLPVLLAICATNLAASWGAEEVEQRLELELVCPVPRWRTYLERFGAVIVAVAIVVAFIGVVFGVVGALVGIHIAWRDGVAALLLLVPLAVSVVAFGFAVSAWRPGAVAALTGSLVGVSFFLDALAPLFGWPDAIRRLSIFRLYGEPILSGVQWGNLATLVAASAVLIGAGTVIFARKDIVR